jgi:alpha/beta superfamily hydrolase
MEPVEMESDLTLEAPGIPPLQARIGLPAAPRAGLVLCHPHPLYGGDMENPVIVRAAEVAREEGVATLRFNFRGVGRSGGVHDEGRGEVADALAALGSLETRLGRAPLGLLGYSFGAWIAAQAVAPGGAGALALVAPPLAMRPLPPVDPARLHVLVAAGTQDPYCPLPDLDRLAASLPGATVERVAGADHFFFGKLFPLGEVVREFCRRWTAIRPGSAAGAAESPSRPTG